MSMVSRRIRACLLFLSCVAGPAAIAGSSPPAVAEPALPVKPSPPPVLPPAPPATLQPNRDRLLGTLASRKGTSVCTLWSELNLAERYVFLTTTAALESPSMSSLPDGTADLDHATTLYTINGPDDTDCGGYDYNRIFVGMDSYSTTYVRGYSNGTQGDGQWGYSGDLCGPHTPFNAREAVWWDTCDPSILLAFACDVPGFIWESVAAERHHWSSNSCASETELNGRRGMCDVSDPSVVEVTYTFDCSHNADPLCTYSEGLGYDVVSSHVGINPDFSYTPTGCTASSPINSDTYGGGTYNGMGASCGGQSGLCNPCTNCLCNITLPLAVDIIEAALNAVTAILADEPWTCPVVGIIWTIKNPDSTFGCIDKTDCGAGECCDPDTGACAPSTDFADGCYDDTLLGVDFGVGGAPAACGASCGVACGCGACGCGGCACAGGGGGPLLIVKDETANAATH